jgi:hypothetical protein
MARLVKDSKKLLFQLRHAKSPEICRLRDRVSQYIDDNGASHRRDDGRRTLSVVRIPRSFVHYVQDHPWLALVTAASLSWTLSHLSTASRRR